MSVFNPVYTLEIRAPRSFPLGTGNNTAEAAILMPPTGAPHRDWFRVATAPVGYGVELSGAGIDSWVKRSAVVSWPSTDFSVEFWVRIDDAVRAAGLFSYAVSAGSDFNHMLVFLAAVGPGAAPGTVQFTAAGVAMGAASNFVDASIVDGKWHHLVWTRSGTTYASYLDGVVKSTGTTTANALTGGGAVVLGQEQDALDGGYDTNQALDGAYDEVKVHSRALSAQEVLERFNGVVSNDANKLLHWSFDVKGVTVVNDDSGTGNHGTANSVSWTNETPCAFKPYMGLPRGRTGRVDMLERTTDVGTMSVDILDPAQDQTKPAERWLTAFLGDSNGDPRMGGLLCRMKESLDGAATFTDFWTGYLTQGSLANLQKYTVTVRDMTSELKKLPLFKGPPHASIAYAGRPLLLPLGIIGASYGIVPPAADLLGAVSSPVSVGGSTLANVAKVNLNQGQAAGKMTNFTTSELLGAVAPNGKYDIGFMGLALAIMPNFAGTARAHLTWNAGANQGDFQVGALQDFRDDKGHHACTGFYIKPLEDTSDLNYSALPANGTAVGLRIYADYRSLGVSLFVDVANVLTFLQDILAGKFSALYRSPERLPAGKVYGDPRRSFANTVSSASVPDLPPARFRIDEGVDDALKWIQENILKPYGLALVCDGSGSFSVVDLRLPQSLSGLATITDADVVASDNALKWDHDREKAIFRGEASLWEDLPLIDRSRAGGITEEYPSIKTLLLAPVEHPLIALSIGSGDFGEKVWKMGGGGYRVMAGDTAVSNADRVVYLQRRIFDQIKLVARPYAHGETTATLECRRTANIAAMVQGQVVQCAVSALPNPATGRRGGTRIVRIVEITRGKLRNTIRLLDLGVASVAGGPTLGTPALGSDPRHTATVAVTLHADGPAEVRYALTASGAGAAPADNDPSWHAYPGNLVYANATITLTELSPGFKVWVQARTFPNDRSSLKLPSAWTTSTGLVLTAYSAPSAVTVTNITANSAKVGWTNGVTSLFIEVWLRSPDSGAYTRVGFLLPGSTFLNLWGLAASTAYGVLIQYRTWFGVLSGSATASFSTTSTPVIHIMPPPPPRRNYL